MNTPLDRLKHHVSGAIERGEKEAIVEQTSSKMRWNSKQEAIEYYYQQGYEVTERYDYTSGCVYMATGESEHASRAVIWWNDENVAVYSEEY